MENTIPLVPNFMSKEAQLQRHYDREDREIRISMARAGVVKSQILRAYEVLEGIRFDYVHDTAFRDKITHAQKSLESAISDFLLRDEYWQEKIIKHRNLTPEQYDEIEKSPVIASGQSDKK